MKIIYICERPYNLLRALLKAVNSTEKPDILITENIKGMEVMCDELKSSKLFNNVYFYDGYRHNTFSHNLKIKKTLAIRKLSDVKYVFSAIYHIIKGFFDYLKSQRISKKITLPEGLILEDYDEIHMTDCTSAVNFYLYHKKYNNLIFVEHGKNALSGEYTKLLDFLKILVKLRIIHGIRGSNRHIKAIEVSENENLTKDTKGKEIREIPFDKLVDDLSAEQGEFIYQLYAKSYKFIFPEASIVDIFLTTTIDGENSKEVHLSLCEVVISDFMSDADVIVIKPHPIDITDYTPITLKDKRCVIMEPCVPAEIFTLSTSVKINTMVHIDSSAEGCYKNINKKITLGYGYLEHKGLYTDIGKTTQ